MRNYFSRNPGKKEIFFYDLKHNHHHGGSLHNHIKHNIINFDNSFHQEMRVIIFYFFIIIQIGNSIFTE